MTIIYARGVELSYNDIQQIVRLSVPDKVETPTLSLHDHCLAVVKAIYVTLQISKKVNVYSVERPMCITRRFNKV